MKFFNKFCTIALCMTVLAATGCTKGSSVKSKDAVGDGQESNESFQYVTGIINEVKDEEYVIKMSGSSIYLISDKCGTDYKNGDSVKVSYAGAVHHYDKDMKEVKTETDRFFLTDGEMYIRADDYVKLSLWENDYSFYGTLEAIYDIRDENRWFGDSIDTLLHFVPLEEEDEGKANKMLGDGAGFSGYSTKINDGAGFSMSMHNTRAKITYDPETMEVTKVELAEDKQ